MTRVMDGHYRYRVLRDAYADRVTNRSYRSFIILWVLLEAWLTDMSGKDRVKDKIDWFKENDNPLKKYWVEINPRPHINSLIGFCPIHDKRPGHEPDPKSFSDPENPTVEELVDILYRVRCNLFHGHDDIYTKDNVNLFCACASILYKWLKWATHKALKNGELT